VIYGIHGIIHMPSRRKLFLLKLIEVPNPSLENTDVQDIALALGLALQEAEAIAMELESDGLIHTVGLGGNIIPTDMGRELAADSNWE
jgi:Mn-dependent DtxR family transcriptional regulator